MRRRAVVIEGASRLRDVPAHGTELSRRRASLREDIRWPRAVDRRTETLSATAFDMRTCACQHFCMGQAHGVSSATRVDPDSAQQVARIMAGLATASRVQILGRLREGSCSVGELTDVVEMAQPAVSHQLRILRDLNLVRGQRQGRLTIYELYDPHVAVLLDEALRHIRHLHEDEEI